MTAPPETGVGVEGRAGSERLAAASSRTRSFLLLPHSLLLHPSSSSCTRAAHAVASPPPRALAPAPILDVMPPNVSSPPPWHSPLGRRSAAARGGVKGRSGSGSGRGDGHGRPRAQACGLTSLRVCRPAGRGGGRKGTARRVPLVLPEEPKSMALATSYHRHLVRPAAAAPRVPLRSIRFAASRSLPRFSVHSVAGSEGLDDGVLGEVEAAAYWTAVAPSVAEYGSAVARAIASGDENVAKGILWCAVMTVDMLRWGNEVLRKRIQTGDNEAEVSPEMLRRINSPGAMLITLLCPSRAW